MTFDDIRNNMKLTKKEIQQRRNSNESQLIGFPDVDYYYEYKRLGGKKDRMEYFEMLDIFLNETYDICIHGDTVKHSTRTKAFETVQRLAKIGDGEFDILFESVDNVTPYS